MGSPVYPKTGGGFLGQSVRNTFLSIDLSGLDLTFVDDDEFALSWLDYTLIEVV